MLFRKRSFIGGLALVVALCVLASIRTAGAQPTPPTPPTYDGLMYGGNYNHSLDLYLPTETQGGLGPFPVVIFIHGGAWLAGDKAQADQYADALLQAGFAVASINHRMSYQDTYPAQLHDCKGAVRWLRAHAAQYNLDPNRFAAFGESTGGHLAALLGTTVGDADQEGGVGGNDSFSSAVQVVVDAYGPTDLLQFAQFSGAAANAVTQLIGHDIYDIIDHQAEPEYADWMALLASGNPATFASAGDAPAYIFHGLADSNVPHAAAELLADALQDAGVQRTLRLAPGVAHELPAVEFSAIVDFLVGQLITPQPNPGDSAIGGANQGDNFGQAIAVLGDLNGDGVDDLLIGAPFNDDAGGDAGSASVHSGATGEHLWTIRGRRPGDRFGWSVAAAGDVNGDGTPDLVVGAPLSDLRGAESGRVEVYAGGTWQRLRGINGERAGDQLGYSLACIDVDGDGRREIVAGAPYANAPLADSGCAIVYANPTGQVLYRIEGGGSKDHLGWAVADAGDVDGDGRGDVLVGAPHADANGANSGAAVVVGFDGNEWITRFVQFGEAGAQLGYALAAAGDVDGDTHPDVLIGAPQAFDSNGVRSGVARVYSVSGDALLAELQAVDGQSGEQFGATLAGAGDIDGDNLADLAIGSWKHSSAGANTGRVGVYRGMGGLLQVLDGAEAGAKFGRCLVGAGDLDGDGRSNLLIGASGMFWGGIRRGVVYSHDPAVAP